MNLRYIASFCALVLLALALPSPVLPPKLPFTFNTATCKWVNAYDFSREVYPTPEQIEARGYPKWWAKLCPGKFPARKEE